MEKLTRQYFPYRQHLEHFPLGKRLENLLYEATKLVNWIGAFKSFLNVNNEGEFTIIKYRKFSRNHFIKLQNWCKSLYYFYGPNFRILKKDIFNSYRGNFFSFFFLIKKKYINAIGNDFFLRSRHLQYIFVVFDSVEIIYKY